MTVVDPSERRTIKLPDGREQLLLLRQLGTTNWIASVLYALNGSVKLETVAAASREQAYASAVTWILNNIDSRATVESL